MGFGGRKPSGTLTTSTWCPLGFDSYRSMHLVSSKTSLLADGSRKGVMVINKHQIDRPPQKGISLPLAGRKRMLRVRKQRIRCERMMNLNQAWVRIKGRVDLESRWFRAKPTDRISICARRFQAGTQEREEYTRGTALYCTGSKTPPWPCSSHEGRAQDSLRGDSVVLKVTHSWRWECRSRLTSEEGTIDSRANPD